MRFSSSPRLFYQFNDKEIRYMTASICRGLSYWGSMDDILQDFYLRLCSRKILSRYRKAKGSLSTWLYCMLKNLVMGHMIADSLFRSRKFTQSVYDWAASDDSYGNIDPDYASMIERNAMADDVEGLAADLAEFEHDFLNGAGSKKYTFDRRRDKGTETDGSTLAQIFRLLYEGYSSHEVAAMHGVSDMAISHLKRKLAEAMVRYGFSPAVASN